VGGRRIAAVRAPLLAFFVRLDNLAFPPDSGPQLCDCQVATRNVGLGLTGQRHWKPLPQGIRARLRLLGGQYPHLTQGELFASCRPIPVHDDPRADNREGLARRRSLEVGIPIQRVPSTASARPRALVSLGKASSAWRPETSFCGGTHRGHPPCVNRSNFTSFLLYADNGVLAGFIKHHQTSATWKRRESLPTLSS